jgi:hypothetical protein
LSTPSHWHHALCAFFFLFVSVRFLFVFRSFLVRFCSFPASPPTTVRGECICAKRLNAIYLLFFSSRLSPVFSFSCLFLLPAPHLPSVKRQQLTRKHEVARGQHEAVRSVRTGLVGFVGFCLSHCLPSVLSSRHASTCTMSARLDCLRLMQCCIVAAVAVWTACTGEVQLAVGLDFGLAVGKKREDVGNAYATCGMWDV